MGDEYLPYSFSMALTRLHHKQKIILGFEGDYPFYRFYKTPMEDIVRGS